MSMPRGKRQVASVLVSQELLKSQKGLGEQLAKYPAWPVQGSSLTTGHLAYAETVQVLEAFLTFGSNMLPLSSLQS